MVIRFKKFTIFFLLLLLSSFLLGASVSAKTTINIITTNDMHGVLEESETAIGVAQASAMKASTPNSLLIDSGDATQGTSLATINKGNDVIRLMNAAGFDAMVAGNHEFDYGSEQLLKNAETADFPILSANADYKSGTFLPATTVLEIAGKKIGLIGITTSTTNSSTNPDLRPGVTFGNEIEAAKKEIAILKDQVDTILLLTHLGNDQSVVPVTSEDLLDGLTDDELSTISAVLDGHSHTIEDEPYIRGSYTIPVIQDQTQMTHIGKVVITFEDNGMITATEEVMDYDTAMAYPLTAEGKSAKEKTLQVIEEVNEEQSTITKEVVATSKSPLWGGYIYWDYAEPRIVETNFSDLVADAFRSTAQQYATSHQLENEVIGMVNGGGIANSIDPGKITVGDILNNFNHGNQFVIFSITPSDLYSVLEKGLTMTGQNTNGMLDRENVSGSFIQPSGFTYTYDPSALYGNKITNVVTTNGTELSREDTSTKLIVGSQNYVQSFFEDPEEITQQGGEDLIIEDYFRSFTSPIDMPIDGQRILIANDRSPEEYSISIPVYSNEENKELQKNKIISVQIDNGDFTSYVTDEDGMITFTLSKGPHSLMAQGASQAVYVNNYSGAGTYYTKPGYYSLEFIVDPEAIFENTQVSLDEDLIYLATGDLSIKTSQEIIASVDEEYSGSIIWSSSAPNVATVTGDGLTAMITAVNEGEATVTVTLDNGNSASVLVVVTNDPVVADDILYSDSSTPDYFTLTLVNVHSNPALDISGNVQLVSFFTWSEPDMSDMNCKLAQQTGNNWSFTFPVNETPMHNFYYRAQNIQFEAYGSLDKNSNGNRLFHAEIAATNEITNPLGNITYISYNQNVGFNRPSVTSGEISGLINDPYSVHMEGLRVSSPWYDYQVRTQVHASDIGWMSPVDNGVYAGTMWQNRAIESIKLTLYSESGQENDLSIRYRVYQNGDWTDWAYDGEEAGITGQNLPLQAVQIELVD